MRHPLHARPEVSLRGLRDALHAVLRDTGTPGASVALVTPDEVIWADGIGFADAASSRPATADTLFRVGSISKSITALLMLRLQERGVVDVSDCLRAVAPEVEFTNPWEAAHPVRMAHLLEHTSGFDDVHMFEATHDDPTPMTLADGIRLNPRSRVARWPPGRYFSYSNVGSGVCGFIAEKVTGQTFEQAVRDCLFDPLQMPTATFLFDAQARSGLATGYAVDRRRAVPYRHITLRPSGALNVTVRELARIVRLLLGRGVIDGRRLLSTDAIARFETPATSLGVQHGLRVGCGLGSMTYGYRGHLSRGHAGGMNGYAALYEYVPGAGIGWVVMTNTANPTGMVKMRDVLHTFATSDRPASVHAPSVPASVPQSVTASRTIGNIRGLPDGGLPLPRLTEAPFSDPPPLTQHSASCDLQWIGIWLCSRCVPRPP